MDDLMFVPLEAHHIAQVEGWSTPRGMNDAHEDRDLQWAALHQDELVAVANISFNNQHVGYLDLVVKPSERRQGIAARFLEYILEQPNVQQLAHLHALTDMDNMAGQKVLTHHGFSQAGYAPDGQLEFSKH